MSALIITLHSYTDVLIFSISCLFFACDMQTNTFQCVLVTDGKVSFAVFLYAEGGIQWTSADTSGGTGGLGGTPAQAGFNAGDGIRSFSLPTSRTDDIADIDHLPGNTGVNGLWIFRVDQEQIDNGDCSNDSKSYKLILILQPYM